MDYNNWKIVSILEAEYLERKEEFRKNHRRAQSLNEDVMKRFYGIISNHNRPVLLRKATFDRLINKYGNKGFFIISAYRSNLSKEQNGEKTKELISELRKSNFSYLPIYSQIDYDENGVDYIPSFVVFNHKRGCKDDYWERLEELAMHLCGKYEQPHVLLKEHELPPICIDKNGNKVNQEHISTILENGSRDTDEISFDECYVNPMPCQITERLCRVGEIMVWE